MYSIIQKSLFKRGVIKRNQDFIELPLKESFKNNVFKFGHFLLDVHEELGVEKLEFNLMNPFNSFDDFKSVVTYFESLQKAQKRTA